MSRLPSEAPASLSSSSKQAKRFGLTQAKRLKNPSDFKNVYSSTQWGGSKHFTFNVLANANSEDNVIGVTVSKKVSKRAVDRNHLKRVMREFYRLRQSELKGASLVLTAKPSSRNANSQERQQSLEELWSKLLKWQRWHQAQERKKADEFSQEKSSNY